jgi:protein-tyrosine phosphatase
MIDIHCHILPGIDDGPSDLAGSVEMARAAVGAGITTVVATPHLRADFPKVKIDEIADRCAELRAAIAQEGIGLELVAGGEVSLSWALEATEDRLALASYGQAGHDLLIETPTVGGAMLPQLLYQVAARGYRVVLAHPERLLDFQQDPALLEQLRWQGILLQVNASAVIGARRAPAAKLARNLCASGLASVVASDGHRGQQWRPVTELGQAREALSKLVDGVATETMLESTPARILAGEPLGQSAAAPPPPQRRSWWRR